MWKQCKSKAYLSPAALYLANVWLCRRRIKSNHIFTAILKQSSLTAFVQNVQKNFTGKFTKDNINHSAALTMLAMAVPEKGYCVPRLSVSETSLLLFVIFMHGCQKHRRLWIFFWLKSMTVSGKPFIMIWTWVPKLISKNYRQNFIDALSIKHLQIDLWKMVTVHRFLVSALLQTGSSTGFTVHGFKVLSDIKSRIW